MEQADLADARPIVRIPLALLQVDQEIIDYVLNDVCGEEEDEKDELPPHQLKVHVVFRLFGGA